MIFKPRAIQLPIIAAVLNKARCAVWASMGSGKTSAVLYAIKVLNMIQPIKVLIVAPKKVAVYTWPEQANQFSDFADLKMSIICGSVCERMRAVLDDADIYCTNFETLPWLLTTLPNRWRINMVVVDEATRLNDFRLRKGSKRAKALFELVQATRPYRFVELTGTPALSGLLGLWGQLYFIDGGARLGTTYTAFKDRWFDHIDYGWFMKPKPKEYALREISDRVRDVCVSVRSEDYFDLKKPIYRNVPVVIDGGLMAGYRKLNKELYLALNNTEVTAANRGVLVQKCLQYTSGAMYTGKGDEYEEIHKEKLDALERVIEEAHGEPVIVAYHFRHEIERIRKRFPMSHLFVDKPGIVDAWNTGDIPILLMHPDSAGHGLNLQYGGRTIVFFTTYYKPESREQAIERIGPLRQIQAGFDRSVYVYSIVARGTIDEKVLLVHQQKISIDEALRG